MAIKVSNTLTKKKELFKPMSTQVKMFVCGPTVYDYSHIGHARTYTAFDIISTYLRWRGFNLFYLQNITDLDDKIIQRAKELGITPKELAVKFESEYYKDMHALGITSVDKYARATDYIPAIINQVKTLMKKDFAYKIDDGIYFDLSKFKEYGKLSGRKSLEAEDAVSRIDENVKKRNKGDFCLWKFSKPGEPKWETDIGDGRSGWHIEDTAITESNFGPQYDIHGGARDLVFPHHEAEIAQMEAASGKKPFVRYWLHTGFLTIKGQKMSKSLGNFVTIRDALKNYDAEALRLFFAFTQYRNPIDYDEKNLKQAQEGLKGLYNSLENILATKVHAEATKDDDKLLKTVEELEEDFTKAMDDDFNTPVALEALFKISGAINKFLEKNDAINNDVKIEVMSKFKSLGNILGILKKEIRHEEEMPEEVRKLVIKREIVRKQGNFKLADEIRQKLLKEYHILLEDTKDGFKWKRV
ncbi:cysteine--tRNA ligase [archaeon]|nr:MAG: cysteine--tRNA ligase [archaeon]